MSDFLGQLVKGFFRSAVNQVGRDTGRVVSGKIYGRPTSGRSRYRNPLPFKHNWVANEPVHVVGPPRTSTDIVLSDGSIKSFGADGDIPYEFAYENFTPIIYESTFTNNLAKLFWLCLLPVYAEIYLVVYWLKSILRKTIPYQGVQSVPVYIRDKTLSTGYRQTGYENEDIFVMVPAHKNQVALIIKGTISLAIAVLLGFAHYYLIIKAVHYLK